MDRDVIRELKGKNVKINLALMGETTSSIYEGIVNCGASYGADFFIVFENETMINLKYIQTIEPIQ